MTVFILALLTALQIQSYDLGDEYYLLLDTGDATVSFSSFRLNEPERIVLEVGGTAVALATPAVGATVGRIERDDLGDKTRFVFHISPGSAYTILHRKNLLLIGFRQELFITDETIETTLAAIDTRMAEKKAALAAAEAEKIAAEQKLLAAAEEAKKLAVITPPAEKATPPGVVSNVAVAKPEKKVAVAVQPAVEDEDALVGTLVAQQTAEKTQRKEETKRIEEQKKAQEEASRLAAEQARLAKAEEERKLAEAKRIEAQRRADEQARLAKTAEERRRAEAEQKRLAEEKRLAAEAEAKRLAELKAAEEKRIAEAKIAEEKRLAALKKAEEEKRIAELKAAEDKRIADAKAAEEARLVALKKAEEDKKLALAKVEPQKTEEPPVSPEDKMKSLKVVKLEPTRKITEEAPPLKVVTLAAKGKLKNLFFRKFPEFSRVTMEVTGELDYAFREVKGGYVIDIHNFEKIPGYLLHIIDTRAFNAEVQYIYPKKEGKIFKIYIKSEQNIAVRKSEEEGLIHFDFYVPTMQ